MSRKEVRIRNVIHDDGRHADVHGSCGNQVSGVTNMRASDVEKRVLHTLRNLVDLSIYADVA